MEIEMVVQVQSDCNGRLVWWRVGVRGWLWSYVVEIWARRCAAAEAVGRVRGLSRFYRSLWLVIVGRKNVGKTQAGGGDGE